MEDLSDEMMPGKPVSPKMRKLLVKEKNEARKRIIERGIIHFRADEEFMSALLSRAELLKIAPGTLCRRIVWEHLRSHNSPQSPQDCLSNIEAVLKELNSEQKNTRAELRKFREEILGPMKKPGRRSV